MSNYSLQMKKTVVATVMQICFEIMSLLKYIILSISVNLNNDEDKVESREQQ